MYHSIKLKLLLWSLSKIMPLNKKMSVRARKWLCHYRADWAHMRLWAQIPQHPWKKPGTGVHVGNPRAGWTEAEGLLDLACQLVFPISEFQVHRETLSQKCRMGSDWRRHLVSTSGLHMPIHGQAHLYTQAHTCMQLTHVRAYTHKVICKNRKNPQWFYFSY